MQDKFMKLNTDLRLKIVEMIKTSGEGSHTEFLFQLLIS